jgi:hypothetical protein
MTGFVDRERIDMNLSDLAKIRLISQQIDGSKLSSPKNALDWMGAIQAQDYEMAKWAIGIRLPGANDKGICAAIDKGEILRTHLLRPTWHFVTKDNIYWILELSAQQIKVSFKSRHIQLGLTNTILRKSNLVLEKALKGGNHLTREELIAELGKAKIPTNDNRASHIFVWAELDGLICSGATKNGKQTYAILEERVPERKPFNREAAMATLAQKYFLSRCPATLQDFVWWSGLTVSAARSALEMTAPNFIPEKINSQTYWFTPSFSFSKTMDKELFLLPAFDEFIISYKDRSATLALENHKKAVSDNGIFRPVIVENGQIIGIWKRTIVKNIVVLQVEFFEPQNKTMSSYVKEAAIQYGHYLDKQIELTIKD